MVKDLVYKIFSTVARSCRSACSRASEDSKCSSLRMRSIKVTSISLPYKESLKSNKCVFVLIFIYRVKVLQCLYENPKRIDSVSVFEQQWYWLRCFVLG